jgi:hypothetical protein
MTPLTAIGIDKIEYFGLPNWMVRFSLFQTEASISCLIHVPTYFDDSAGESTTSNTSSMKIGGFGVNGSDLDKNNIIKPTFNTLTEEDRKVLETYRMEVDELFYSCYEVTRQGLILKDTTSVNILKVEVTSEVRPNPSFSLDDVQCMINSILERQAKRNDELMRRLIEEWDGKKLVDSNVNPSSTKWCISSYFWDVATNYDQHIWARVHVPHLAFLCQILVQRHTPPGVTIEYTQTPTATTKPRTLS